MKFHWGHGIAAFYSFFVATLVIVVIKSTAFDNSLVTEQYYARDLNYQQEFDRRQNSDRLLESVRLETGANGQELVFPAGGQVNGTVLFYRPSTRHDDRKFNLRVNPSGRMPLNFTGMTLGRYQAIVEWSADGVSYYDELDLTVNP